MSSRVILGIYPAEGVRPCVLVLKYSDIGDNVSDFPDLGVALNGAKQTFMYMYLPSQRNCFTSARSAYTSHNMELY